MPLRQAQLHPEIPGSSGHDAGYGPAGTFFRSVARDLAADRRATKRRIFSRAPHSAMLHQRRLPFFVSSRNR